MDKTIDQLDTELDAMNSSERLLALRNITLRRPELMAELQRLIEELHHLNNVEAVHRMRLYGTDPHAQKQN